MNERLKAKTKAAMTDRARHRCRAGDRRRDPVGPHPGSNSRYIAHYLRRSDRDARNARRSRCRGGIVAALNALRARYDYVFTTGGIGPTHDDITADGVAKAFGVDARRKTHALSRCCSNGSSRRPQRGAPAHGADTGGRRAGRQSDLQGAGVLDRQCHRHGRGAVDHAGHARRCGAETR